MKKAILIFLAVVTLLAGCEREERTSRIVIGMGDVVTETISVSNFHSVRVVGIENLTLNTGDNQVLKISAQENIIDVMNRKVKDGVLTLDFPSKTTITTTEPISVEIIHPDLTSVTVEGIDNFELDGEYSKDIDLEFAGIGNMDAYALFLSICNFTLSGSGNCKVRVDSILHVTLSGTGNVLYKGDAEVSSTITGVGQVIDDN